MKSIYFLLVFIQVLSYTYGTGVASVKTKYSMACPEECRYSLNLCVVETNRLKRFTAYPPQNDDLGKCYCRLMDKYFACLSCYASKTPGEKYIKEDIEMNCKLFNFPMNTDTQTDPNATGTTNAQQTQGASVENKNSTITKIKPDKIEQDKKKSSGGSSHIGLIIIGVVAAAGVIGFIVYTRKQKQRPESMPFFGNTATSPNQYATLNTPKEMSMSESTNNLTTDYNNQYYNDNGYNDTNNQYYGQNNYNQQNQYDNNYSGYNNQYPSNSYENDVVSGNYPPPPAPATGNYESRRESMMPNSQPTGTSFTGVYVVAYKYDPQLDDELELQVNDQVQIIEEYEDGWMKAVNLTTGKEGMAPRVCIKEA